MSLGLLVCRVGISQHDDCDLLRPRKLRSKRIAVYAVLCLKIQYALGMGLDGSALEGLSIRLDFR